MSENVYQDVHDALQTFEGFLNDPATFTAIQTVVTALKPHVPQIGELLTQLITLMGQLETEIAKLNVGQVTALAGQVTGLLTSAGAILPDQAETIQTLEGVVGDIAEFLPLITQIIGFITTIKAKLETLNA
jgi:ABC-type transporter Mla subunit MlaD